jgi:hypothetical protein
MSDHTYPLARPYTDEKFTTGLVIEVAAVLQEHGYPPVTSGGDLVRLQQALFGFVYGTAEEAGR